MNQISQEKVQEYLNYLQCHISAVQKAYNEYVRPIVPEEDQKLLPYIDQQVLLHDKQKYDPFSFVAYLNHFYLSDTNPQQFSNATHNHVKLSPHHWAFWLDQNLDFKDPSTIDIPDGLNYIEYLKVSYIEMLADWFSFNFIEHTSKTAEKFHEWYERNKSTIIIHPDLSEWLQSMINQLIQKSKDLVGMPQQPEIITNEDEYMDNLVDDMVEDMDTNLDKELFKLVQDENDAIEGYNRFLDYVKENHPDKYNMFEHQIIHIRDEEKEHIRELEELQEKLNG